MVAISRVNQDIIEMAIRRTGFYRIKVKRLKSLTSHVMRIYGSIEAMVKKPHPLCMIPFPPAGAVAIADYAKSSGAKRGVVNERSRV